MNIEFTPAAWDDYLWFQHHDRRLLKRINDLIKETTRTPFEGTGKPEPLKANLSGYWSILVEKNQLRTPACIQGYRISFGDHCLSVPL